MTILALSLLLLSALPSFPLVFTTRGPGPEGPVGLHMITGPIALLQAVALGICIHGGAWDFGWSSRWFFYALLPGYIIAMTILPALALPGQPSRPAAQGAFVVVLAAALTAAGAMLAPPPPLALRIATGAVLALPALAGTAMVAWFALQSQANAVRKAADDVERMDQFQRNQIAFDAGEWAKLPAEAGLWQLITFTHSFNLEVRKACHERIAARPALEADVIALLGTGWAEHAVSYLRDFYPLRHAPLAAAFGAFLEKERAGWEVRLRQGNAMSWEANISGLFEVAAKIAKDGGDIAGPLKPWLALLEEVHLGGLAWRVKQILDGKA